MKQVISCEPADRPRAEGALRKVYRPGLDREGPKYIFWFDSPARAGWAVKLLESTHESLWKAFVEDKSRTREGRLFIEGLRDELCEKSGLAWEELTQIAGRNRTQQFALTSLALLRNELHGLDELIRNKAWKKEHPQHSEYLDKLNSLDADPEVWAYERQICNALRGYETCGIGTGSYHVKLGNSLWCNLSSGQHYTFAKMAQDEQLVAAQGVSAPEGLTWAWDVARNSGPCWAFEGAAMMLERPRELRFNDEMLLHCGDGPAGYFRDGTEIWARNGKPCPPPSFKKLAPPSRKARKTKTFDRLLDSMSPAATAEERIAILRGAGAARLPLLDRYLAGEYESVWRDLIALGDKVREEAHAADALAVAYETMDRVSANVRTVSERLIASGFAKAKGTPLYAGPKPDVQAKIRELEKSTGQLPISLRAFYEVAGTVNWIGSHPALAVTEDPLVVEPIEEALAYAEFFEDDEDKFVVISSDELMKAGTSGGDPYQIATPDAAADAPLRFERHKLHFVEYLRLSFRHGGFPGYEGVEFPPAQLAALSAGLREF